MKTPKEYLAAIGSKGGKKSRRKLSKKEARRIAKLRWAVPMEPVSDAARAAGVAQLREARERLKGGA